MPNSDFISMKFKQLSRYIFLAFVFLTLIFISSLVWNIIQNNKHILDLAKDRANAYFEKEDAIRKWASLHGGIYVPTNERTPPNPHLSHVPERDIETPSGKRLTLMNPAYMMRQMNEEYPHARVSGHITSLKLMRPENEADEWEKKALKSFERSIKVVSKVTEFKGEPYLRLMKPLIVKKGCLKCHAIMGYKVGDIRGGTSVSISLVQFYKVRDKSNIALVLSHFIFWILGISVLVFIYYRQKQRIYEQDKARLEKEEFQARLVQSQKMEVIGILAGGVAHDFNNLLTVINGYAEMALDNIDKDNKLYKDLTAILAAGNRAKTITGQLLAFSRKQVYNPELLNINELISSMDRMLRRLIGEDIKVETVFADNLPNIKADKSQLEQIFINLIVNSRDALRAVKKPDYQKKITIETGQVFLDKEYIVKHQGSVEGQHIFFAVSDNGIGMVEQTKQKVFEPFFTTKEKYKGTGLGLSMIYGIVKQNNSSIYVYSEPDEGTIFKIYWLATEEKRNDKNTEIDKKLLHGNENILIVEDDKEVCHFAGKSLASLGYKVLKAENGQIALDLIKSKKPELDLIITDLVMPELNGKEFADKVRKILPDIKVIFVSGYTDNHIVHNGLLEEGVNFIHKPYSMKILASTVHKVLDE